MKIIKKIINDKNIILIYRIKNKIYVDKIFNNKNLEYLKKEVLGYKFFKKNSYFNIPKLYSSRVNDKSGKITIQFIDGKKVKITDLNKIYKRKVFVKKKIIIEKYILDLIKTYKIKINNPLIKKLIQNNSLSKRKIFVAMTHGDFVHYNCLMRNKIYYVLDFEKYRQRIVVFDCLNWFVHPLLLKFFWFFSPKNKNLVIKILNNISLKFFNFIIKKFTRNFFYNYKIDINNFNLYYLLFLIEKILIIHRDISYVHDKKEKKIAYKQIKILKYIYQNLQK
tara:strand:+ start:6707 stop:7543 length:837 start_codon:yes stop_codon:yes gene_type:complete